MLATLRYVTVISAWSAVALLSLGCLGCKGIKNARLNRLADAEAEPLSASASPSASPSVATTTVTPPRPLDPAPPASQSVDQRIAEDAADARKNAWLSTPLSGHDNNMAAIRLVTIKPDETLGHKLVIKNQFGLTCGLRFGPNGSPAEITTQCRGDDGWGAGEERIPLVCDEKETQEICRGKYTLTAPQNFRSPSVLQIIRPIKAPKKP